MIRTRILVPITFSIITMIIFTGCASLVAGSTGERALVPESNAETELNYAGVVSSKLTSWNWFFQSSAEERRAVLEQAALKQARERYGDEAVIKPESLSGAWNPASLLMLFGAAGFIEDAEITASVWLPSEPEPEPEPEPQPAVKTGIRYIVVPEAEYTNQAEFTNVVYKPVEQLEAELEEAFAAGKLSVAQFEKKRSRLPAAGTVFITYGRTELTNAISRWFRFTLNQDGERFFRKRGIEDIPYVYGNDKLWWNDMSFNVDRGWSGSLDFEIEDKFQNRFYNYKIVREVYEISDSE